MSFSILTKSCLLVGFVVMCKHVLYKYVINSELTVFNMDHKYETKLDGADLLLVAKAYFKGADCDFHCLFSAMVQEVHS